MPRVKRKNRSVAVRRLPRVASPAHQSKAKKSKSSRELSERRPQSSVKSKKVERRLSVAPQAGKRQTAKTSLSASVYDTKGKVVGKVSLPAEIFGVEENPKLIAQAVRVYLANQKQETVSTKTRGEVQGSSRKIYRQKGTGRARHGSIRAPIFVKGGIVFGPKPRDLSLQLPQKMKRKALFSALSKKLTDGEIKIVDKLEKIAPKTKIMAKTLKAFEVNNKNTKTLLITPKGYSDFENVYRSARNIVGVKILTSQALNTYEVLDNGKIILMKDSIDEIKKNFLRN